MNARVLVTGIDESGVVRARIPLSHGSDPRRLLAVAGWSAQQLIDIVGTAPDGQIRVDYRVRRAEGLAQDPQSRPPVLGAPTTIPLPRQRIAAYAVVRSSRGVLLTELSARTSSPGTWNLPGGGLEPAEAPDAAVTREVWEETGQQIRLQGAVEVTSRHWVGQAPSGVWEDFHAVGLIYRAHCAHPSDPVVHDVGGTTASAAWVNQEDLGQVKLSTGVRALLEEH